MEFKTPVRSSRHAVSQKESGDNGKEVFSVPETPGLKQLGYGTGVGVYHLERSPCNAGARSPWALKKVLRTHKNSVYSHLLNDEASVLRKLNHPNVIGYRGFKVLEDGRNVLAMEACSISLGNMIEDRFSEQLGPFPSSKILTVAANIAEALRYLHDEVKIMHGDIKSFNVLVNGDFEAVKLCDFGVSLKLDKNGKAIGDYIGTNCWSAPEALLNEDVTSRSDIFPFGITLWEMIALMPPHMNESILSDTSNLDESEYFSDEGSYGTRPNLPEIKLGDDYNIIVQVFEQCTEIEQNNRPTAKEILNLLS